eukprot:4668213-Alexandrium_andersonii.AAC.1
MGSPRILPHRRAQAPDLVFGDRNAQRTGGRSGPVEPRLRRNQSSRAATVLSPMTRSSSWVAARGGPAGCHPPRFGSLVRSIPR